MIVRSLIAGLSCVCIALVIERLMLYGRSKLLQAKQRAYRFHALRDKLQIMAVNGRLETSSLTYNFLTFSLNLAIKNAETMRLRDILRLTDTVKERVEQTRFEAISDDIARHDEEIGALAGQIFYTFFEILVANDVLVAAGIKAHRKVKNSWSVIRPFLRFVNHAVATLLNIFAPTRLHAFGRAREYQNWAARLGCC